MSLKVGALFAGYGGLELALSSVLDCEPVWFSEFDKAPSKILAHHWPGVPNLGDVTRIDWHSVEPVDVITGGSPCQDLSHAGKRQGMKAGTRSGLWASMCDAVDIIRPQLVVWENVRGALSAEADSGLEQCPGCVGDPDDGAVLRALGRVLGDLADIGYDARWYGLRAADVGAAHGRFRVFLFATPADSHDQGLQERRDTRGVPATQVGAPAAVDGGRGSRPGLTLLPSPRTSDTNGPGAHGDGGLDLRTVAALLPTPRVTRGGSASETRDMLLHTPSLAGHALGGGASDRAKLRQDWREYEAAIRRQEAAFGRPAPMPTEPGAKGQPRLSPKFVEWLMALPDGWVTNVPGISRNDALKALGNGVCVPQAVAAFTAFLNDCASEARRATA